MSRVQGTIKWFSNRKGYGFVTPKSENSPTKEDIFVHFSSITSDGYRSLYEGWDVEFDVVTDDDGKLKAVNVTAPGGGPCTGPRIRHGPRRTDADAGEHQNGGTNGNRKKKERPAPQPKWHEELAQSVKDSLTDKSISLATGTIDVAFDTARVKLGTGAYTSMVDSSGYLAEGSYTHSEDGTIKLTWDRALKLDSGEWKSMPVESVEPKTLNLSDDKIMAVGQDETAETLWGADTPKPRDALEANGFQMRQVVLTARPRRGRVGTKRE